MRRLATLTNLIASKGSPTVGDIVEVQGASSAGDGGFGQWQYNGSSGTPSQTPAQLGNAYATDADGNRWELTKITNDVQLGGDEANLIATNNLIFQAIINALPATGGEIDILGGDYTSTLGTSFTISNKAITFNLKNGSLLPNDLPVVIKKEGVYSLPETSIQANRNVRVHDYRDITKSIADASLRQYAQHIDGFVDEAGLTTEVEFRGYSYDIGTDALDSDVEVRGIKGRVYGNGGASNIRGMYSFVEGVDTSGFTGQLTAFLGTVYKNDTSPTESVAIRGHVDDGCTAAFQAAGAGITPTDTVSHGFHCRTGTGQPLLPTVSCFTAHGGGSGDMFLGYASNTDTSIANAPFRVKNDGSMKVATAYSGQASINDDDFTAITPPAQSGMIEVFAENTSQAFIKIYFRAAGTALAQNAYAGTLAASTTGALNGTTGADTFLTVSSDSTSGDIYIENRMGATKSVVWRFTAYTSG